MMRRPLGTQPNLDEPPPGPTPGPPTRDGWPPGSRPPAFRTPVLTYALIGVNVAMWLVTALVGPGDWLHQLVSPDMSTLMLLGAKVGPAIRGGEYWRLVTATFLHYGIIHLAVNMWALLQLGTRWTKRWRPDATRQAGIFCYRDLVKAMFGGETASIP